MAEYKISDKYIVIKESFDVPKKEFGQIIDELKLICPEHPVLQNRSKFSLKMEWSSHNLLYMLNIEPNRTKDVDFDPKLDYEMCIKYTLLGLIGWIFIK